MKSIDYGKISVIIPTYNRGKLIEKSVNSVLGQSYKNIEVIVIDDGSTDNTENVIRSINDERLVYIKLEGNHGACNARNVGIDNSTGKYIAFQDSDDIFYKNKLEKQIKNLIKKKADLDFCSIKINFFDNSVVIPNDDIKKRLKKSSVIDLLCEGNFISTQAILAKKEVFRKIRFDVSLPRFQDYDLVLRIALKYSISFSEEVLVDLYRQDDSISFNDEKLKKACSIMFRKVYGLNDIQQNIFDGTLFFWATNPEFCKLDYEYKKLLGDFKWLENNYNNLVKSHSELRSEYDKIISSKRWKVLNRILKLFGK